MLYHDERTRMLARETARKAGTGAAGEEELLSVCQFFTAPALRHAPQHR